MVPKSVWLTSTEQAATALGKLWQAVFECLDDSCQFQPSGSSLNIPSIHTHTKHNNWPDLHKSMREQLRWSPRPILDTSMTSLSLCVCVCVCVCVRVCVCVCVCLSSPSSLQSVCYFSVPTACSQGDPPGPGCILRSPGQLNSNWG